MAIIGPLIACKNLSKFFRDSADSAILRGESPQTLAINKNKLTQWPPRLKRGGSFWFAATGPRQKADHQKVVGFSAFWTGSTLALETPLISQ